MQVGAWGYLPPPLEFVNKISEGELQPQAGIVPGPTRGSALAPLSLLALIPSGPSGPSGLRSGPLALWPSGPLARRAGKPEGQNDRRARRARRTRRAK